MVMVPGRVKPIWPRASWMAARAWPALRPGGAVLGAPLGQDPARSGLAHGVGRRACRMCRPAMYTVKEAPALIVREGRYGLPGAHGLCDRTAAAGRGWHGGARAVPVRHGAGDP